MSALFAARSLVRGAAIRFIDVLDLCRNFYSRRSRKPTSGARTPDVFAICLSIRVYIDQTTETGLHSCLQGRNYSSVRSMRSYKLRPPSRTSTCPVANSKLIRNVTASAISRGRPLRFNGARWL